MGVIWGFTALGAQNYIYKTHRVSGILCLVSRTYHWLVPCEAQANTDRRRVWVDDRIIVNIAMVAQTYWGILFRIVMWLTEKSIDWL